MLVVFLIFLYLIVDGDNSCFLKSSVLEMKISFSCFVKQKMKTLFFRCDEIQNVWPLHPSPPYNEL